MASIATITEDKLSHALDYIFSLHLDALLLSAEIFKYVESHKCLILLTFMIAGRFTANQGCEQDDGS